MSAGPSAPRRLEAVIILSRIASLQCGMAGAVELSLFGVLTSDEIWRRCESWVDKMSCRMFTGVLCSVQTVNLHTAQHTNVQNVKSWQSIDKGGN